MAVIEQRFVPGPSRWSNASCLRTTADLGPLADCLTTDVPGLTGRLIEQFPALLSVAEPMHRGCFIVEVLGWTMLEMQRLAGTPAGARVNLAQRGHGTRVTLLVACRTQAAGAAAFDAALAAIRSACAHSALAAEAQRRRLSAPIQINPLPAPPPAPRRQPELRPPAAP